MSTEHLGWYWKKRVRELQRLNNQLHVKNWQLEKLALNDALTCLPNRRSLIATLDQELARADRYGHACTVLFLDIDDFKSINDSYGHSVGDAVLKEFGEVIRSSLRRGDIVGRWGGDELLLILPAARDIGAQRVAGRIRSKLTTHSFIGKEDFHLTCSIGIATYPLIARDRKQLIVAADQAMYNAKEQARRQKACSEHITKILVAEMGSYERR